MNTITKHRQGCDFLGRSVCFILNMCLNCKLCKENDVSITIETALNVPLDDIYLVMPYVNRFMWILNTWMMKDM